jgi:tetratricopeptide (TPR) repeat protein
MEVVGMKEGRRPRDAALLDAAYARDLEAAASLLAAGRALDAWGRYEAAGRDFAGLREVTEARAGADRLRDTRAVRDTRRARQKNLEREVRALEHARQALATNGQEDSSGGLGPLLARMDVPGLKRRAAGPDYEERRFAERVLESMASQTGFYLPRDLMARGDHARARRALQVAHEIQPDNPSVWYMLARVSARLGRAEEALGWLGKVAGAGLLDRARAESESDFASLRGREAFEALLGR